MGLMISPSPPQGQALMPTETTDNKSALPSEFQLAEYVFVPGAVYPLSDEVITMEGGWGYYHVTDMEAEV